MSPLNTIRRHRVAALLGVALVASPLAVVPVLHSTEALAATDTAPASMGDVHHSYASIVNEVRPAVVTVTTKMKMTSASGQQIPGMGNSPFDQFFRQFFGQNGIPFPQQQSPRGRVEEALGSGFIIDPSGIIVTNNHVIANAEQITVTLDDGTKLPAKLVGHDKKTDLAVLRVKYDKPLPTVAWGDSAKAQVGDQILAVGNPFGIGVTVTSGIVSARGRDLHNGPYDDFIQIDAPINHGNSGGPLVNMDGQVVGINSAIYTPNGGSVGVGFAIPSDQAKAVVAKLLKNGKIEHGYIGVMIQPVTQDVANAIGLDKAQGALVAHVNDDTPAASAGVKQGDVITAFNGKDVPSPRELARVVSDTTPGTKSTLTVWRQGKSVDLSIDVGNANNEQVASNDNSQSQGNENGLTVPSVGLGLANITPDMRNQLNLPEDVHGAIVESVNPNKSAADSGMQQGDVILSVNQKPVDSARAAKDAISEAKKQGRKSVLLLVQRSGNQTFVAIPLGNA